MLWNPEENPALGVSIRRNVSRIKRLKALSPSKIITELGEQYAPEYPPEKITGRMCQNALKQVGQFELKRLGQYRLKQVGQITPKWVGQYGVRLSIIITSKLWFYIFH